jgi:starch synthase (maltosyl-transferring)
VESLACRLSRPPEGPVPERPVPVALVITDLDVGGAERALVSLATGLDRSRWAPVVVALGGEGVLADPLRAAGIPTTCLGVCRSRPLGAVVRLVRALRPHRPALVQSFLFHANIAARLAALGVGGPWVVCGLRVAERRKPWHLWLDRWTQRLAVGSVCVSRGVADFSRSVAGLDPRRLSVIPNGIDPSGFDNAQAIDRASLGIPEGAVLALFVGRLEYQKGLDTLLAALALPPVATRRDLHLVIAGDGPEREQMLAAIAANPELSGRARWLGRRADVPNLLATADFLVLPSRWEGMPNIVLEAMAARRAVIATAVEGSEDLVVAGQTGWLVAPGDAPALALALHEAATNPARRLAYGMAGRERVEREFSRRSVIAAYDRLWSRVLGFPED